MRIDRQRIDETLSTAAERLLAEAGAEGHWHGELSASALSTATAVWALSAVDPRAHAPLVRRGLHWLAEHQNGDGGWGDTTLSRSNISTTMLVWSALEAGGPSAACRRAVAGAEAWIERQAGGLDPAALARAVAGRYGRDRTFSVPILSMCALAGRLGAVPEAFGRIAPLPFELAALPHGWLKALRLPVVSYALPALIALGQLRHHFRPPPNPLTRALRDALRGPALAVLERIQPAAGGFLEAAPLTGFVVMSLAAMGRARHPVARRGAAFLVRGVRGDGSWPIDTNLATWVTTLAVDALSAAGRLGEHLDAARRGRIVEWLLAQQHRAVHPYTHAAAGGWAWTDLPGGVPDADDTAGALIALDRLARTDPHALQAAAAGAGWLAGLQNRDGGIPTFCRGWGTLPFDRSAADLTAHALAALAAWDERLPPPAAGRARRAAGKTLRFLRRAQRDDGAWVPLWFGNEHAPGQANPTYGTARVVAALRTPAVGGRPGVAGMIARAAGWLAAAQGPDGGWGGAPGVTPSIEETALAVGALAGTAGADDAVARGVRWLIDRTDAGREMPPAPIGFYFAKLWYFERLYPLLFTVWALGRVRAGST